MSETETREPGCTCIEVYRGSADRAALWEAVGTCPVHAGDTRWLTGLARLIDSDRYALYVEAKATDAELSRLRGVVEAVQALADEWDEERRPGMVGISRALRAALAPVSSSGEAESRDDEHPILASLREALDAAQRLVPIAFAERDAARAEVAALRSAVSALADECERAIGAAQQPDITPLRFRDVADRLRYLASVGSSGEAESGYNVAGCTCGFGGFHDDINPRCALYVAPAAAAPSGGQADGEGPTRVMDEAGLLALPSRSVIAGPAWNSEVYLKAGRDEWFAPAQPDEWTSRTLSHRGPFVVLRFGDEPLAARPILSREAVVTALSEHRPLIAGDVPCECGVERQWHTRVGYLGHLADVLAGGEQA